MYKRSLKDKIKNNCISKYLRNKFGIFPVFIDTQKISKSSIISDSFIWRTDNGFETTFKFSDILRLFLEKKGTKVIFNFYDKKNNLILKKQLQKLDYSNRININKFFLNGIESYGNFLVFLKFDNFDYHEKIIFGNRCYLGFSKNGSCASMVHGNTYSVSKTFDLSEETKDFVGISLFKKQNYIIQNSFSDFDYSELFFTNPTSKNIKFNVLEKNYSLSKYNSIIVKVKHKSIINIKSNCYWLRPIIFNYRNNFLDVYHS